MGTFLVYIFKSAVYLLIFYTFHKLVLGNETFHRFNRWIWCLVIVVSLVLPCIDLGFPTDVSGESQMVLPPELTLPAADEIYWPAEGSDSRGTFAPFIRAFFFIYMAGCLVVFLRMVYSYLLLYRFIREKKKVKVPDSCRDTLEEIKTGLGIKRNVRLLMSREPAAPCSWMHYIIISRADTEEDVREILIHELSHIRHRHSLDLLLADTVILFQWFNPAAWLLKQSIQQVHEYQADESVLEAGVNARQYQLLLIKKAVGQRLYTMANSFNHSKLKNRLTMMVKQKSKKRAYAKCFYALPLALLSASAFAVPEISGAFEEISKVEFKQNFPKDTSGFLKGHQVPVENIGTILQEFPDPVIFLDGRESDKEKVKKLDPKDIQSYTVLKGEAALKVIKILQNGNRKEVKERGLVLVERKKDRKEISSMTVRGEIKRIRTSDSIPRKAAIGIEKVKRGIEVNVKTDNDSVPVQYRRTDRSRKISDDTLEIILVESPEKMISAVPVLTGGIETDPVSGQEKIKMHINERPETSKEAAEIPEVLWIINGKEAEGKEIQSELKPDDIKSILVLKDTKAVEKYGIKGSNGVIEITLKEGVVRP